MHLKLALGAACAAFALNAGAGSADAAIYLATFKGHFAGGYDYDGVFGAPGEVAPLAFTAVYTFDSAKPGAEPTGIPGFTSDSSGYHDTNPLRGAITVEGGVKIALSDYYGTMRRTSPDYFGSSIYAQVIALDMIGPRQERTNLDASMFSSINPFTTEDLELSIDYAAVPGDQGAGYLERFSNNATTGEDFHSSFSIALAVDSVTFGLAPAAPTAAPEPSAWALLILGFGAAGSALRARRRQTA